MCVCEERTNMVLGKFERIMEYVDIVLRIRKICTVQMENLTLEVADVRVHREEICVKWVFFFLIISDYFLKKLKQLGKQWVETKGLDKLRKILKRFFVEFVETREICRN